MEIFTVYKIYPMNGWGSEYKQTTSFAKLREIVNRYLYDKKVPVKVTAIFARTSRFHETREAITTFFDIESQHDPDAPIKVNIEGASWEDLEEVSGFANGVPQEYYERDPLWS